MFGNKTETENKEEPSVNGHTPNGDYEEFFSNHIGTEDQYQITVYKFPDNKAPNQKLDWVDVYDHIPEKKALGLRVGGAKVKFIGKNLKTKEEKTTTYKFHESWNLLKLKHDREEYQKYGSMAGPIYTPQQNNQGSNNNFDQFLEILKVVGTFQNNNNPSDAYDSIIKKSMTNSLDYVHKLAEIKGKEITSKTKETEAEKVDGKQEFLLALGDKVMDKLDKWGDKLLNGGQITTKMAKKKIKSDPLFKQVQDNQEVLNIVFDNLVEEEGKEKAIALFKKSGIAEEISEENLPEDLKTPDAQPTD